jgi:Caspase domain
MKALLTLAFITAATLCSQAAERVALVIGNSAYQHNVPLPNALPDARLVAKRLSDLGYQVTDIGTCENLSKKDFNRRLAAFGTTAIGAKVALFYYAGHGIGLGQQQYLLPVDCMAEQEADLKVEAITLEEVSSTLTTAGVQAKVIILDCCRTNPFEPKPNAAPIQRDWITRSAGGLRPIEGDLPPGTAIMFSAAPGQAALDGPTGSNSPFATALTQTIGIAGPDGNPQPIFNTLMAISTAVETATTRQKDGKLVKQEPYLKFDGKPQLLVSLSFAGQKVHAAMVSGSSLVGSIASSIASTPTLTDEHRTPGRFYSLIGRVISPIVGLIWMLA